MIEVEELRDDVKYYGEFGQQYLSNSDVGVLLNNPRMFKKAKPSTLPMLHGRYFHSMILEPHKLIHFPISEVSSRTAKQYKEDLSHCSEGMIMLRKEVNEMQYLGKKLKENVFLNELIYDSNNKYEEPAIGNIGGLMWKGKADIITNDLIIDLKTTTRLDDFKYTANRYNYDSQAWVYNKLFDLPMLFVAIEKGSGRLGMFDCSDEFLAYGEDKVFQALEIYNTFFGENPTENIDQYIINKTL